MLLTTRYSLLTTYYLPLTTCYVLLATYSAGESKDAQGLSEQCVALLDSGLVVWPDANIKLQYFDKQISSSSDALGALLTGISILRSILKRQPRFLLRNFKQLQHLLRPSFESYLDNARMLTSLCSFLREAIPALTACCEADPNSQTQAACNSSLNPDVSPTP